MEHWVVSTAFVHAPLKERVYMKQPSGHEEKGKEKYVCLLVKALYGTEQAAHAWQLHLRKFLGEEGFMPLVLDPATYAKRNGDAFTLVGTHVDDLFVVSNGQGRKMKESLWAFLSLKLAIKTVGEAKWTLQMLIQRDAQAGVLKISQESCVDLVLRRFNKTNCKPAPTPAVDTGTEATMTEENVPTTSEGLKEIEDFSFLELIVCL